MSCPDLRLHAHGRTRSEPPPPRGRGRSLGIVAAWFGSFGSHAAVTAWILLAAPLAEPEVDRGALFGVEIVVEEALAGSEVSAPAPASASAPEAATPPESVEEPVKTAARAEPVMPASSETAVSVPEAGAKPQPDTFAPVPRRPQRILPAVSIQDAPNAAPSPESSVAAAIDAPAPADEMASLSAPAVSGAHAKADNAIPRAGNRNPEYPAYAQRRGIEGRVILMVDVRADGTAAHVAVAESSSHESLDAAAVEAVRRWTFQPGRRDGVPVESRVQVPITFRLIGR